MSEVGAIILAAGRSSRYFAAGGEGATKLVAPLQGLPVVRHVAAAALASRARPVIVVVGHARAAVEAALAGLPLEIRVNPDFASGIASSLRVGLDALPDSAGGALILLGDMPLIEAALLDAQIAEFLMKPALLAVTPIFEGKRGNPVLLGRALFPAARLLQGDEGARRIIAQADSRGIAEIPAPGGGVAYDIDTPAELRFLSARSAAPGDQSSGDGEPRR